MKIFSSLSRPYSFLRHNIVKVYSAPPQKFQNLAKVIKECNLITFLGGPRTKARLKDCLRFNVSTWLRSLRMIKTWIQVRFTYFYLKSKNLEPSSLEFGYSIYWKEIECPKPNRPQILGSKTILFSPLYESIVNIFLRKCSYKVGLVWRLGWCNPF